MKQVFDQLLKFLQQGISAIFHFVELIWMWSVDQITKLMAQAHGRAMAGLAAAETGSAGPDPGWSALGALQSRLGAFGSRCGDLGCIRGPAWRARSNATPGIFSGSYRPGRRVARQSPRQFVIAGAELDAGQRTK